MATTVFRDQELEYQRWLKAYPEGYVLNARRDVSPSYMVLHRANCRTISRYVGKIAENGFTGRGYIKICSTRSGELLAWLRTQGGRGFTVVCSICAPANTEDVVKARKG